MGIRDDDPGLAAFAALVQTHAFLVESLERDLVARRRLPLTWFEVLLRLAEAPEGAMRMQDLARSAWLSKSGMTRLVDRMQEAGFVERQACATDRRVTYAAITAAGRAELAQAAPEHLGDVERTFSRHLTASERRELRRLLGKVLAANGQALDESCASIDAVEPPAAAG